MIWNKKENFTLDTTYGFKFQTMALYKKPHTIQKTAFALIKTTDYSCIISEINKKAPCMVI